MVSSPETVDPDAEVAVERQRDVRRPERGHDLEPCSFENAGPVQPQDRGVFEPIGSQVTDIGVAAGVDRREPPSTPVREAPTEVDRLQLRRAVDQVVATHDDQRVYRQRRSTHTGHPLAQTRVLPSRCDAHFLAVEADRLAAELRGSAPIDQAASQLLRDRVPIKVVSERLGHSNPTFTMTTYQSVLPGM